MENNLEIFFIKENETITINIEQPDLSGLIHKIVAKNLCVTRENVEIKTENDNFDKEEFLSILVEVHEEFSKEIELFYSNIQKEIKTYYKHDELSEAVISYIKGLYEESVD